MELKAAMFMGWMALSAPPTIITSALPERISCRPWKKASVPEAQADTGVMAQARALNSMLTEEALPLGMSMGTVMGLTRRCPLVRMVSHPSRRVHTPPMPVPKATPRRNGSTSSLESASLPENPASVQASRAAATDSWPEGSRRLACTRDTTSSAGLGHCAPMRTGRSYSSTQSSSRA